MLRQPRPDGVSGRAVVSRPFEKAQAAGANDYLADAIKASSKGTIGPLPADPKFGQDAELVSPALVERLKEEEKRRQLAQSQAAKAREAGGG